MRACEGCRRRKIKCDAATTNTWPCSACIRLKLHCVRPNAQYEGSPEESHPYEPSRADYEAGQENFRQMAMQQPAPQHMMATGHPKTTMYASPPGSYSNHQAVYPLTQYGDATSVQQHIPYGSLPPPSSVSVLDPALCAYRRFSNATIARDVRFPFWLITRVLSYGSV